jgi:hypothetical protein
LLVRIGWIVAPLIAGPLVACGGSAGGTGEHDTGSDGSLQDSAPIDGAQAMADAPNGSSVDATVEDVTVHDANDGGVVGADDGGVVDAKSDGVVGANDATLDAGAGADSSLPDAEVPDALAEAAAGADAGPIVCGPCTGTIFNGRCVETLATGQLVPKSVATDGVNVYWTVDPQIADAGAVMRVSVCGGTPTPIASGSIHPQFVAVDDQNLYWTQSPSNVMAWNKGTGAITTLVSDQAYPSGIIVDSANLYWANDVADGGLVRMPLDGGAPTEIVYAPNPYRLVLSPTAIYWIEAFTYLIFTAPRAGGARTNFYYDSNYEVQNIGIDAKNLYYTEMSSLGPLVALPLDGGAASTLARDNGTRGVVSDGTYVYFASPDGDAPTFDGEIVRVSVDGGAPTVLATGGSPEEIAIDGTSVYWTSTGSSIVGKVSPR